MIYLDICRELSVIRRPPGATTLLARNERSSIVMIYLLIIDVTNMFMFSILTSYSSNFIYVSMLYNLPFAPEPLCNIYSIKA